MKKKSKQITLYDEVESYCKKEYRARYLKMRNRAIVNMILPGYPELQDIPKDRLMLFAKEVQSYARAFRQVMENHPEWTNEQEKYEKMIKEQQTQINLGYTPGFHQDVNLLSNIKHL